MPLSFAKPVLDFAGPECPFAGFVGGAPVFAGVAGRASCKLVVHPGNVLLDTGEVGGRCSDLLAQRRGVLDQFSGVKWLAYQIPLALCHRPVDLRLLPHLARIRTPQRSLAAIQLLPGGGKQSPRAFQGLVCAPPSAFCIGTESSCTLV